MSKLRENRSETGNRVKAVSDDCIVLIVAANGNIREHLSGDGQDLLGVATVAASTSIASVLDPALADALRRNIRNCLRSRKPYRLEATASRDETVRQIELQLLPNGRDSALVLLHDRTSSARFNAQVHELAFRDPLTDLPNEAAFMHALADAVRNSLLREQPLAVLRVHLQGIRAINHNFSRGAGNHVLCKSALRLAEASLLKDCRLAHLSGSMRLQLARTRGDEFSLLVIGAPSAATVEETARAVNAELSKPYAFAENRLDITGSIGVALFPQDGADADTLLCNADTALADAKATGGNSVSFFSRPHHAARQNRFDLEQELRWALGENQFSLLFLPCFDFASGEIASAEALLRWRHPLRGEVPVDEIIPLTELSGLDEAIGSWVTQAACSAAALCRLKADIKVSLNLGARHATSRQTPERIADQILQCGLLPSRMLLEIRSADYFRHRRTMERSVKDLGERGIGVVLDDFRAAAMHLESLAGSGVHSLKISRALIARLSSDQSARRCTAAIIALAHSLDMTCSATGVETRSQYELLQSMQCDTYQGFLKSVPLTLEELLPRLGHVEPPVARQA